MHDQPKYTPLRSTPFFGDVRSARPLVAGNRGAGTAARGSVPRDGQDRQRRRHGLSVPGGRGGHGPRTRALRDLLHAVPRPHRNRRRHDRPARLPPAADVSRRSAAQRADRPLRRRHGQRLRRDAGLLGPGRRPRSMGDRGVHPRAAAQPARHDSPTSPNASEERSGNGLRADSRRPDPGAPASPAHAADRRRGRPAAVGRRRAVQPDAVLPVVPDGVHVLPRRHARLPRARDGAPAVGRRVGRRASPADRRRRRACCRS